MFDAEALTDEEIILRFKKVFHREMTQEEKRAFLLHMTEEQKAKLYDGPEWKRGANV